VILRKPQVRLPAFSPRLGGPLGHLVKFAAGTGADFGQAELRTRASPVITGSIGRAYASAGVAGKTAAATSRATYSVPSPIGNAANGYAICVIAAPVQSGAVGRALVIGDELASAYTSIQFAFELSPDTGAATTNSAALYEYSSGNGARAGAYGKLDGGWHVFVANRPSGTSASPSIWVDGVDSTSSAHTSANSNTPAATVSVHSSSGASSSQGSTDPILFSVVFSRALTVGEIKSMPTPELVCAAVFSPRRIYIPTSVAAGGLPTLTSLGISGITTTGAILTTNA
jgi:hypothetical protein